MSTACVNTAYKWGRLITYLQHLIELHHMELFCMPSTSMLDLHEDGHRLQTSERLHVVSKGLKKLVDASWTDHCNCDKEVI